MIIIIVFEVCAFVRCIWSWSLILLFVYFVFGFWIVLFWSISLSLFLSLSLSLSKFEPILVILAATTFYLYSYSCCWCICGCSNKFLILCECRSIESCTRTNSRVAIACHDLPFLIILIRLVCSDVDNSLYFNNNNIDIHKLKYYYIICYMFNIELVCKIDVIIYFRFKQVIQTY